MRRAPFLRRIARVVAACFAGACATLAGAKTGAATPPAHAESAASKPAPRAAILPAPYPTPLDAPRPLDLRLPTDNRALFDGPPETFFMGVDRTTEGKTQLVWEGGQYGFVRNPFKLGEETVYTRFHEGIDIAPTLRDNRGEPLDLVRAIGGGRVVFINDKPRASNYGNYVVVEHDWGYGAFYSLYAHLMRVDAVPGEPVRKGDVLGRLGYTGSGLDRRRAHCHLEINMLLSSRFERWQQAAAPAGEDAPPPAPNLFHGHNLAGLDAAAFFKALAADPTLTIPRFLATQQPYFKVLAPAGPEWPDILRRYPWLCPLALSPKTKIDCPAWEISLSASGLPLSMKPSAQAATQPIVVAVVPFAGKHSWKTMGRVGGTGTAAELTRKGASYIELLLGRF